jgi:PmbA protein
MVTLSELSLKAFNLAKRGKVDDVSSIASLSKTLMVRFSNNTITVAKSFEETELILYIGWKEGKKRIVGATTSISDKAVESFVDNLVREGIKQDESEDYSELPRGPFKYKEHKSKDKELDHEDAINILIDYVKRAVDSALDAGANRVAGAITANITKLHILTSGNVDSEDFSTSVDLNIRAFYDSEVSGHGLSCSSHLSRINPEQAGQRAGEHAKQSAKLGSWEEGIYDIILTPTVAADIVQYVGAFSSAHYVQMGISFLAEQLNKEVAVNGLSIKDSALAEGSLHARSFDDEGYPTGETEIISKGILKSYLHNSTTSKRFKVSDTGNAGIITPMPWNLIVSEGDMSLEDMIREVKKGFLITNNWYTRFQNLRTGEFSTLPRDATYYIENGEIKYAVKGVRISDQILRELKAIDGIGKDREWIMWWEVEIPTLCPSLLIREARVTKAT